MRGATNGAWQYRVYTPFQSTLLMRGATKTAEQTWTAMLISIHAPHARSDVLMFGVPYHPIRFQSTLLMRGATLTPCAHPSRRYFNPRSSCEERPQDLVDLRNMIIFQSTLLMRGATRMAGNGTSVGNISIHAPHARSDDCRGVGHTGQRRISIHAPHARSDCVNFRH